jgi:hypothetical protein
VGTLTWCPVSVFLDYILHGAIAAAALMASVDPIDDPIDPIDEIQLIPPGLCFYVPVR